MKRYYIAAFMPAQAGGLDIIIPDISGAESWAETLGEAYARGQEVLSLKLREMSGQKKAIPEPSPLERVRQKTAQHLLKKGQDPAGEILYQIIPAPNLDMMPVEITISFPKAILEDIDAKAKEEGLSRARFLGMAAAAFKRAQK